jgi:hypothetical protein
LDAKRRVVEAISFWTLTNRDHPPLSQFRGRPVDFGQDDRIMITYSLSERDICTKRITPALHRAGWDIASQIREEVGFTKGRIIVRELG